MEPGYYPPFEKLTGLVLSGENIDEALPFLRTLTCEKQEGPLILTQQLATFGFKKQALALLEELGTNLDDDKLLSLKGQTLMVAGEYARALETFEAIPQTSEAYENTLVLRVVLRDIAGGAAGKNVWEEIDHAGFKEDYLQFLRVLDLALSQKDTLPALDGWKQAVTKEDYNFYQLRIWKVADLLLALHEFDAFPRVIALFKAFGVSEEDEAITLARLYRKYNFHESAAAEAIKAIQRGKEEADLYVILGEAAMDQNLTAEAEAFYRKAVELEPEKVVLYTSLIKILISEKKYREATLLCQEARKVSPESDLLKGVSNLVKSVSDMETTGTQFGG
jgi:tetratricopeptide (TPR) repeat protein